jgi:hypothetical protein
VAIAFSQKPINHFQLEIRRLTSTAKGKKSVHWSEKLLVDRKELTKHCIDYSQLVASITEDGEFEIFTRGCESAGCAGIWSGITVEHDEEFIHWSMKEPVPNTFRFSATQYRQAIHAGLLAASKIITTKGKPPIGSYLFTREEFEKCLKISGQ